MKMPKLPFKLTSIACFFLLLFTTTIQSFVARTLGGLPPPQRRRHHHRTMTFYMPNMLNSNLPYPPTTQPTTKVNNQPLPFSKPVEEIPIYDSNPIPSQTSSLSGIGSGISFLASAVLQEELEFGMVNVIDVDLLEITNLYGMTTFGKAIGIYVASSEDGSGRMMTMTTSFLENDFKDELRFFGVHQAGIKSESHISVIGGTGKYEGANGYAIIKVAKLSSKIIKDNEENNNYLLVEVYLG